MSAAGPSLARKKLRQALSLSPPIARKSPSLRRMTSSLARVKLGRLKSIPAELMKRDIAKCDHVKFIEAQEKLTALRKEALALVSPIFKRLVKSLDDQLNETAIGAEQRLAAAGLPVRNGEAWLLHDDALCKAVWSCRHIAERTLAELSPENAIGATQWFCSDEEDVPFTWLT